MNRFRVRILPPLLAFAGSLLFVFWVLMFGFPQLRRTAPVPEPSDPVQAAHERLLRIDQEYGERIATMDRLSGNTRGSNEVLAMARKTVSASAGNLSAAARRAESDLGGGAAKLSSEASRYGIDIGPRMTTESLELRIRAPKTREAFCETLYDFQRAACVFRLLTAAQPASPP